MTYEEALEKIDSLLVFGSKPGLDRIKKLLDTMGNPQDDLKFVHVAGTNGKGSVCNMLSCILTKAGYKTGLFTSPHITCFGERMQINGEIIPNADVVRQVEQLFPLVEKMRENGEIITEFEFVMAMCFNWFREQKCDIVVLETGLGGLMDCTNVIKTPLCSVITSISYDHTAILGNTLEEIAMQKCGIIKEGGRTVFGLQQDIVNKCVFETAQRMNNVLHTPMKVDMISTSLNGTVVEFEGEKLTMPLLGKHQLLNVALVFSTVDALRHSGVKISTQDVCRGIENVKLPARFEKLSDNPLVIADGAHNPDGMRVLSNAINEYLGDKRIICVLGMLKDKDSHEAAKFLHGKIDTLITTTVPDSPRRQTAEELKKNLEDLGFEAIAKEVPVEAVDLALEKAREDENSVVLICGSLYLVAHLREAVLNKK